MIGGISPVPMHLRVSIRTVATKYIRQVDITGLSKPYRGTNH